MVHSLEATYKFFLLVAFGWKISYSAIKKSHCHRRSDQDHIFLEQLQLQVFITSSNLRTKPAMASSKDPSTEDGSFSKLWYAARHPPADPTHISFKGKAVLVTGASTGLGHAAAIKYAAQGASPLLVACRTHEKAEAARAAVVRAAGCDEGDVVAVAGDLSTLTGTRALAEAVRARLPPGRGGLHVAQLAAGLANPGFVTGPTGHEAATEVVVLSTALLGLLLLPLLREAARADPAGPPPVMSLVNSRAIRGVTAETVPAPDDCQTLIGRLDDASKYTDTSQYFLVKLASFFVMEGLIERSRAEGDRGSIVINANCPGMCATNLGRGYNWINQIMMVIFYFLFARTAEQGARTLVSATGLGAESTGKLWMGDRCEEQVPLIPPDA